MTDDTYRASTPEELAARFMDPNRPKSEEEHWAVREIERLRAENERLTRLSRQVAEALSDTLARHSRMGDEVERLDEDNERLSNERDTALAEVDRQRAEIEQLQRSFDDGYLMLEATQQANDKLRSENELLREALRWYADPRNHFPVKWRYPGDPDPSVVFLMELPRDGGSRARRVLEDKP